MEYDDLFGRASFYFGFTLPPVMSPLLQPPAHRSFPHMRLLFLPLLLSLVTAAAPPPPADLLSAISNRAWTVSMDLV
jgi:hypothetical protein